MHTFLSLLIGWIRQLHYFLFGPDLTAPVPSPVPIAQWHRALYQPRAVRDRLYLIGMALLSFMPFGARAQFVSLNVPIGTTPSSFTQNFNSLPSSGLLDIGITTAGLLGTGGNGIYSNQLLVRASTGAPDLLNLATGQYSFGSDATDRALGSNSNLTNTSSGVIPIRYGVLIRNTTGYPLSSLDVSYTGEQWYRDGDRAAQSLTFDYVRMGTTFNAVNALLLLTGDVATLGGNTYTPVSSLSFTSPNFVPGSATELDGNATANRDARKGTITFEDPLPVNAYILLRWTDVDDSEGFGDLLDTDHSLAIDDLSVTAAIINSAPTVVAGGITNPQTATVSSPFTLRASAGFTDLETPGSLTYAATGLPASLSINATTGVITGTPSTTVGSPYTVTVRVTDPLGLSVSSGFTLNVVPANLAPILTATPITTPQSATVGVAFSTTTAAAFSDPDGGILAYSATGLPSGVTISPTTGVISGSPTVSGAFSVTVTARDPANGSVSTSFALNVSPAPPAGISITGNTVLCAGQTLTLTALPVNIPGLVTISAAAPTGSVTVNGTSITVTGLPSGVSTLTVTASVASLSVVSVPVSVTVNDLPVFTSALSTTATPGSLLTLGSCSLGGTVSYTVLGGTSAGTTGSGSLSLTPELAGQSIRIACTGTACPGAATTLNLPSLSVALNVSVPSLVCEGQPLSLTLLPTGIDISNPLLAVGISGPANLTVSALSPSGVVTVQGLPAGSSTLTVSLSLSSSQIASVQVPVSVSPTPTQPTQPTTLTTTVGSEFALSASALCPTGSLLTVGGLTGLSSILVPTVTAGTQSLTVLCTNGSCLSLPTVVNVNVVAPVLSAVVSPSVCVGTPLSLTLLPTTGIDPLAPGLTVTASTSSGSLTVGVLTNGVVSLSGGNLTAGLNQPLSVSVNLGGITLASTTLSINVLDTPPTPTQPGTLTATVGNVLSLTGLCPTGTLVSLGSLTGSGSILVPTTTAGTQSLTVLCSNGTCVGLPTIVNVDVLGTLTASVPTAVCVNQPFSLTVLPTGFDLTQTGIGVTVTTPSGALTVGALNNGVLTISSGALTVGPNQPLTVNVTLAGQTIASTTVNLNVLDTPPTPTQPGTLTATVGNVLSLTGLCPTGTLVSLGSLTGSGSILVPTTTAGTQSLTVLCSNGTCVGLPTIVNVDVLAPVLSAVVSPSVCVGTPLSLTLLPSTGIDPLAPGLTVTASTSSGSLTVGVLTNGVVSLSGGNLTAGLNQPLSVSVNLGGITLASTTLSINVLDTPPTPTQPGTLTATVGNVLSLTGLCPTGTLVSLGSLTGSGSILVPTTTAGTQSLTVLCSNGTCVGLPTIVNVDVLGTLTASVPTAVCVNQPFSLTVLPTGFDLTQTGIGITVTTPSGALTVGALNNGVLTISSGALTVGPNQPLTVNVTLAGQTIASTTVNLNVLAQPAAPTPVAALTATVGSVLSLSASALCPTGSLLTLGSLDGSGSILVPTTTIGSRSLTVLCTNGTCLSLPTVIDVSVVAPVLSVSATAAICVGQPASLTILPTNFGINDGIVSLSITGPANINVSAINNDGVVTITGLPAGSQVLTITATVAGAQVATFQTPTIIVTSVAAPAIVSASGGTYPSGQTSLTVTQNTGNVLFNASCSSGTFSYTGSDNSNGTGGTITVPTTATGVFSYTGVCTSNSCVSEATVVSVTVVAPINNAPTIVGNGLISPQSATVGVGFTTPTAYAFNDDGTLTYSVAGLPAGLDINGTTGVISGTPTVSGPFTVTVTATDVANQSVSDDFVLNVSPAPVVNNPPTIVGNGLISPQSATVGVGFTTPTAYAFNDDGTLTYSVAGLPAGLDINATTGQITGAPTVAGSFTVTVTATDAANQSVSDDFVLNVVPVNNPPTIVGNGLISPQSATVGVGFTTETAYAFNDDGSLTYSVAGLPAGLDINGTTGVISGTPTVAGSFTVLVTATDAANQSVSDDFVLNVVPVNNAPTIVGNGLISPQSATVGVGFTTPTAYAFNDDGTLTYSVAGLPAGLDINGTTGVISGTPTVSGPFTVTVTATDVANQSVSDDFVLNVVPANNAPTIVGNGLISPQSATVGVGFTTPTAYAFNDDGTLTYSVAGLPAGLDINATTGQITGTPTVAGSFTVLVTATDAANQSVSDDFVLNVVPVNNPPTVVGNGLISPQSATVGVGFTTPTAYAFNDDGTLTYSVSGLPNGLDINATTGQITGTPTVAGSFTVLVTATDAANQSVSDDFILNVVPAPVVNNPPMIVGNGLESPKSGTVGVGLTIETAYAFTDDGALTYSATGLPNGVVINPTTGVISGAPSLSGTFGIIVTATDVANQSISDDFTLNVVNPTAPVSCGSSNLDGSPLRATMPLYDCAQITTTGAIQFTGAGGNPSGGVIEFSAIGITDWTSNCNVVIDREARTACDAPAIEIRIRQLVNGQYVYGTPFVFNIRQACPVQGCGNTPPTNQSPIVSGSIPSPQTATVGANYSTPTANAFTDPDGGMLTYSAGPLPNGITINPTTGVISGVASTTVGSPFTVIVTATDPQNASATTSYVLNVVNPAPGNQSPMLTGTPIPSPQTATVGSSYSTPTASAFTDPDGGPLTYSAGPLPNGITINPTTGVISGVASTTAGSPFTVVVTATDPQNASVSTNFVLNVVNPTAPVSCGSSNLDGSPLRATMPLYDCAQITTTGAIQFTGAGGNPSGGVIEFSAIGITDWTSNCNVVIDREARTACDAPAIEIRIRQLVNGQYVYGTPFVFNIRQACPVQGCGNTPPTNQSPVLTGTPITSPQTATVGIGYSTTTAAAFTDPDGGMLTYSAGPLPNGVTINPTTGVISGTPTTANGSPFTVVVTATDPQNASVTATYVLNVVPGGGSPVCGSSNLDGSPLRATMPVYNCATITTTGDIQFTGAGGSATGGPIEFKSIGITDWTTNCRAIVDRETRTFCDASPIEIQIRQLVNGEYVYGTSFIFNIRQACPIAGCNVPEPNRAPVVNAGIPDQVATVGKLFDFDMPRNAFMDPDGDELLYTSSQLPESLTFSSGHFNGYLPTAGTLQVTITAYDNHGGSASTTFRIVVSPAENTTPTTPPTTPGPTACGSSNLDGSTLRATQPVFDCAQIATTGAIQFTSTGGNASGGVIEYKAVGVTDWTSNCQVTIDRETRTACDAPAIEIQIRQLVNGQYVYGTPFSFNLRQACPIQGCSGARVAAPTVVEVPLDVRVLGNPTTADEVAVEIRGGEGKALHVIIVNAQGALISEHTIEKAATVEQQTVWLGRTSGVYLLKVSIPGQSQTVKVIKQ